MVEWKVFNFTDHNLSVVIETEVKDTTSKLAFLDIILNLRRHSYRRITDIQSESELFFQLWN